MTKKKKTTRTKTAKKETKKAPSATRGGTQSRKPSSTKKPKPASSSTKPAASNGRGSNRQGAGLLGRLKLPEIKNPFGGSKKPTTGRKGAPKSTPAPKNREEAWRPRGMAVGFILLGITALAVLGMLSTNQGYITGALLNGLWTLFGWGMPFALLGTGLTGFWLVLWGIKSAPTLSPVKIVGSLLLFVVFESFAAVMAVLMNNGLYTLDEVLAAQVGGGFLGYIIAQALIEAISMGGMIFVLAILGVVGLFLVTGTRLSDIVALLQAAPAAEPAPAAATQVSMPLFEPVRESAVIAPPVEADEEEAEAEEEEAEPPVPAERPRRKSRGGKSGKSRTTAPKKPKVEPVRETPVSSPAAPQGIFVGRDVDKVNSWRLPVVEEMLDLGSDTSANDTHIHQQALIIEETLTSFGAPGQVVDINYGPTIIQYCVEPRFLVQRSGKRTKVKVGKIASLADDIALALAARSVRVQAPVPGKPYVGIEVPNESKALVSLRDIMESADFMKLAKKTSLAVGLGDDVAGQPKSILLPKMPHMLIAGATGSGKSVCVNAIIACLLLQNTPEDLRLVMVDPKRVELTGYNGIPHLAAPVVVDMERVVGTLQWAMREMDNRYHLFSDRGARNIEDYNKMMRKSRKKKLPYIVIVIDELADLMMMSPEETERSIARLAQMARATGIHMIIATQRPSVDVVTGLIKANFPARIAFAVASSTDSRVVLDTVGAERLLGQGDMLFQSPDAPAPLRMQGAFVSDAELNRIIDYWKRAQREALSSMPGGGSNAEKTVNVFTAATDAVHKDELKQEVWDVDEEEDIERKETGEALISHSGAQTGAESLMLDEAPEGANPLMPDDFDEEIPEEDEPRPKREKRAKESQPPLWEEMRDKVVQAQEDALISKQYGDDEYWDEAVELVRELGKASTSLLQRRFRIGYTRAARLIDRMEDEGIIGPMIGNNRAREVLPASNSEDSG